MNPDYLTWCYGYTGQNRTRLSVNVIHRIVFNPLEIRTHNPAIFSNMKISNFRRMMYAVYFHITRAHLIIRPSRQTTQDNQISITFSLMVFLPTLFMEQSTI